MGGWLHAGDRYTENARKDGGNRAFIILEVILEKRDISVSLHGCRNPFNKRGACKALAMYTPTVHTEMHRGCKRMCLQL